MRNNLLRLTVSDRARNDRALCSILLRALSFALLRGDRSDKQAIKGMFLSTFSKILTLSPTEDRTRQARA